MFIPVRMPPDPPFICYCGREYRLASQWEYRHSDGSVTGQRCCSARCATNGLAEYAYWQILRWK